MNDGPSFRGIEAPKFLDDAAPDDLGQRAGVDAALRPLRNGLIRHGLRGMTALPTREHQHRRLFDKGRVIRGARATPWLSVSRDRISDAPQLIFADGTHKERRHGLIGGWQLLDPTRQCVALHG
jgi:hypothetical protein